MTLADDLLPDATVTEGHPESAKRPPVKPGANRPRRHPGRRPMLIIGVCSIVPAMVALSVLLGPRLRSPRQLAADAAPPPPSLVTAQVERRSLVEPVVLRGTVKPGRSIALKPPPDATGESSVVTSVAVREGQRLSEGRVLLVRSGEPVFAFVLPFPLYRDLTPGAIGPDVAAVQRVLSRLGYATGIRGRFDETTQRSVQALYRDRGQRLPEATGDDGSTGEPSATPDGVNQRGGTRPQQGRSGSAGVTLARSAVVRIDRPGRRISKVRVRIGTVLTDADKAMIELDGGRTYLEAKVPADSLPLLEVGQHATVVDDVTGSRAKAMITKIGSKLVTGDGNGGESGFPVRFDFDGRPMQDAEDRTVRIDVAAASDTGEVLAVPVTAIFSQPDGGTFVTVVRARNDTTDVEVTPGRIAGGWVEIEKAPADLIRPGAAVVVSERNETAAGGTDGGG